MQNAKAPDYRTLVADDTIFGSATLLKGSQLADALSHLRGLARAGSRSQAAVDAETAQLIDTYKGARP